VGTNASAVIPIDVREGPFHAVKTNVVRQAEYAERATVCGIYSGLAVLIAIGSEEGFSGSPVVFSVAKGAVLGGVMVGYNEVRRCASIELLVQEELQPYIAKSERVAITSGSVYPEFELSDVNPRSWAA